jgi:hypothetical protein
MIPANANDWRLKGGAATPSAAADPEALRVSLEVSFDPVEDSYRSIQYKLFERLPAAYKSLDDQADTESAIADFKVQVFDKTYDLAEVIWRSLTAAFRQQTVVLDVIRTGTAEYRLLRPLQANFQPCADRAWEFHVDGFSPRFVGLGSSIAEARNNWKDTVHIAFQRLVHRRPFRMTAEEKQEWALLEQLIDVEHYRKSTPLKIRSLGWVSGTGTGPRVITWIGGDRVEQVTLDQMPPEFAAFDNDQWFEAIVEREPRTFKLIRASFVQRRNPLGRMTKQELDQWWDSLPRTGNLPPSDSDWSNLNSAQ